MPKKKNFLGGQQNYNPNNGQYEPALKGPNGESPSQFSSFKKAESKDKDESFDAINKKRMGKEQKSDIKFNPNDDHYKLKSPEITNTDAYLTAPIVSALEKAEGRSLENDELRKIVKDMAEKNPNATPEEFEKLLLNYKGGSNDETADEFIDRLEDRFTELEGDVSTSAIDNEEYVAGYKALKDELEQNKDKLDAETYEHYKDAIDRVLSHNGSSDLSKEEIVKAMKEWYMPNYFDKEVYDYTKMSDDEIYNAYLGELEQYGDELNEEIRKNLKKDENNSFDQINAKRMGKELPKSEETKKSHKSADRKDKYGNPLVSDDAFKVGQKAAKEYLDQLNKGEGFDAAKGSFVTLGGFRDAISDALEQAGLNPDYDLTYQDLNEIIGSVTGEEVDFEDYEGNGKGWTGKKYSGYKPRETENHKYNSLDEVIKEWNSVLDSATKMSNDEFMAKYDELRKEFDRLGGNKKK